MSQVSLEYATHKVPPPPRSELFVVAIIGWAVAAICGFGCVALFALTWSDILIIGGFFWLLLGGLITAAAFVCGMLYSRGARACHYQPPHTKLRATFATLLPLSNGLLAIGCIVLGTMLLSEAEKHFGATIVNSSGVSVDDAALIFEDGRSYSFGALAVDESSSEQMVRLTAGRITLRATQGGRHWDHVALEYIDEDDVRGSHSFEFTIDPPP